MSQGYQIWHSQILQCPLVVAPCSGFFRDAHLHRFGWMFRDPPFFRQIYNMTNYYQILQNWWPNWTDPYKDNTETVPRQYCNSNETVPRQHRNCSATVLTDQWDSAVTSPQQYWDSTETVPWQYWDSTLTLLRQWPLTVAPCHSMAWAPKARRPK